METFKQLVLEKPYALVITVIILCIVIIEIGHFYRDEIQGPLKTPIVQVPSFTLDWWSASHFLLFAFVGFVIPRRTTEFVLIGAGWEIFEDFMASDSHTQLVDCKKQDADGAFARSLWCHGVEDSYWYAKADDILMNTLGYVVGNEIRTRYVTSW
jgi:hypothetical protein